MARTLKVLAIHGLGNQGQTTWASDWEAAVRQSCPQLDRLGMAFVPFQYDEILEQIRLNAGDYLRAFWKLVRSGWTHYFTPAAPPRAAVERGLVDNIDYWLQWHAGYVVAWVERQDFRAQVREKLHTALAECQPDLVLAHSLGSLIAYDLFSQQDERPSRSQRRGKFSDMMFVSLGSQIGHPFVVGNLAPGRIVPLPLRRWVHLFNPLDDVFTAEIRLPGTDNFLQVLTPFDSPGPGDHSAIEYLHHPATLANLWLPWTLELEGEGGASAQVASLERAMRAPRVVRKGRRRALLVGINEYPHPGMALEGCVNDVFRMSEVLQEYDFPPEAIRVVLNDRATAMGIRERLVWLLDDVAVGDEIVFFYSGHGAQIPIYGENEEVDHLDETLVPYDFEWTPESGVTDDQIYGLYSQLPEGVSLVMILDCCHAGGLHRDGGTRIRGLVPPDDIRHRALRWDAEAGMWVQRSLPPLNPVFSDDPQAVRDYCGSSGAVVRLGRAMAVRLLGWEAYEAMKKRRGARFVGPYLPTILQACQEEELAYEYRHGSQCFGAFTYSMTEILRRFTKITFQRLVAETRVRLKALGYNQTPALLGPRKALRSPVPWLRG